MWTSKTVGSVIKAVTEIEMNVELNPNVGVSAVISHPRITKAKAGSNVHKKPCTPPSQAPQLTKEYPAPELGWTYPRLSRALASLPVFWVSSMFRIAKQTLEQCQLNVLDKASGPYNKAPTGCLGGGLVFNIP